MNTLQKLRSLVGDIQKAKSTTQAQPHWDLAGRLLARMPVDAATLEQVINTHDVPGLDAMIVRLESPGAERKSTDYASRFSKEELERAMHAFKKRLKLARLADESKLGGRKLTPGHKSEIAAILPPDEYPMEMWQALEQLGQLKHTGHGFYALP